MLRRISIRTAALYMVVSFSLRPAALGAGGRAAHGLRARVVDIGKLGAVDPRDDGGVAHDVRGEPERGTAERVEAVQVLLAEVHVHGGGVVAERFFGAGRDRG